jgi:hypothetical protein
MGGTGKRRGEFALGGGARRHRRTRASAFALVALASLVFAPGASAASLFSKLPGEMLQRRYAPAAAALPDGKVLIAGGFAAEAAVLASAEVYDPATGKAEPLTGEMKVPHGESATVALPDGGVLVIGGWSEATEALQTAELFDPYTNTFEKLPNEMTLSRDGPGAVLLPSGNVFITGGQQKGGGEDTKTAELYDLFTRTFSPVKGLAFQGRYQPSVAWLPTGKVLIAGGASGPPANQFLKTAELFDPASETFQKLEGSGHELVEARAEAGAVTLQNGKVIIAGGFNKTKLSEALATSEVFDSATNTFTTLPDVLNEARDGVTGVLLPDGRALFIGGFNGVLSGEARWLKTIEATSVPAASATTGPPSSVGITTAGLTGTVFTEARATVYFQYGTSTAYGSATSPQTLAYGAAPQAVATPLTGLIPGTVYHFRVVAENAGGTSVGADLSFKTEPPVPVLASVKQSHSRWREGSALADASSRRAPVGTAFSFALNTPAHVTFTFTQKVGGRKVHGKCVAPSHHNRHARHCTRTVTSGVLAVNGHVGSNTLTFQGRISHAKKLRPGAYMVVITAVGSTGEAAAPQRLSFTIVR